ncbi:MAG: hypothetical protein AAGJ40_21260 [Planctomycetota bacterium]
MKQITLLVTLFAFLLVGCSDGGTSVVTEGLQKSDIEKYNEMMAESNASMEDSDEAQAAYEKNPPKN